MKHCAPPHRRPGRALARGATLGALLLATAAAQAQAPAPGGTAQARVLSSTPLTEQGQVTGYSVEYEYAGQRYTTRLPQPPGATLPVQVTPLGVSTYPVAPQDVPAGQPLDASGPPADGAAPWAHVQPQPGVVTSGSAPPPVYAPSYGVAVPAAPVYVYPQAPVYLHPSYAYPYPPVNLSFSLGYSRGWGGWRGYGHPRGWR
ncbi:hypothetical protein [Xenophilus sp. Marseille-Q4582]|uniref:hypothetical protein n=1 Tax=Xenophilus sp. Marseille-Q4582 TaxID=2866600 RepID=UPI001CE41449|nr:hypothetical protein [Xenophilus sp. Marseille-Q4582]